MNLELYIAKRLTFRSKRTFSKTIVFIAIFAIALSIAIMIISISIVKGYQKQIKEKLTGFASHIQVTRTKLVYTYESEPVDYSQNYVRTIQKHPGFDHIQVFANKPGIISTASDIEGIILKGVSTDFKPDFLKKMMVSGKIPDFSRSSAENSIVISEFIAKRLQVKTGDPLIVYFVQNPPRTRKFTISGIYSTGIEELDKVFAICDIRHIQKLNGWQENQIGGYEIFIKDFKQIQFLNEISRAAAPFDQDSKMITEIYPQIFDWLNLLNVNVRVILILMILVAVVNMTTALLVIIVEKTTMIAILKSLGARNFSVSKIFIYHSAMLISAGILIGNIFAFTLLFLQYQFHFFTLPPEHYYLSYVPVMFTWDLFIILNVLSFLLCTLAMLMPAAFVSRISPIRALRFQ